MTTAERADSLVLGLDVGGTKTSALLVDSTDRVLAYEVAPTGRADFPSGLIELTRRTLDGADGARHRLRAIGVGTPGSVDAAAGTVRLAVNLTEDEVHVGPVLTSKFGVACYVEHDARAAAMWLATQEPGVKALGFVSVGTGISAGVVVDGVPLRGATGLAGEVGHVVAVPDGPLCPCGLAGCLEAVASGPAIGRHAAERVPSRRLVGPATSVDAALTAPAVYAAAAAGDPDALAIADEVGTHLARAIRGLVLAFGLDRVVVGGGVARAGAAFFEPIQRALDVERARSALVRAVLPPDLVRLLPPDVDAGARGAVTVARAGIRAAGLAAMAKEGG